MMDLTTISDDQLDAVQDRLADLLWEVSIERVRRMGANHECDTCVPRGQAYG